MKEYVVVYRSRYYPLEGERRKMVYGSSKQDIRDRWHEIMWTDEYRIVRIIEVR